MPSLDKLILPDGTRMDAFALSGAYARLSGAQFTGDVEIQTNSPSLILDNSTTTYAGLVFHRSGAWKATLGVNTSNDVELLIPSGKKFKITVE